MKIKLISQDEFESKLQSLNNEIERIRFCYGLRCDTIFGSTYDVLCVTQRQLSWRDDPITQYMIQIPEGFRRYIPQWLVEEIYEEEIEL